MKLLVAMNVLGYQTPYIFEGNQSEDGVVRVELAAGEARKAAGIVSDEEDTPSGPLADALAALKKE